MVLFEAENSIQMGLNSFRKHHLAHLTKTKIHFNNSANSHCKNNYPKWASKRGTNKSRKSLFKKHSSVPIQ